MDSAAIDTPEIQHHIQQHIRRRERENQAGSDDSDGGSDDDEGRSAGLGGFWEIACGTPLLPNPIATEGCSETDSDGDKGAGRARTLLPKEKLLHVYS